MTPRKRGHPPLCDEALVPIAIRIPVSLRDDVMRMVNELDGVSLSRYVGTALEVLVESDSEWLADVADGPVDPVASEQQR